MMIKRAIAAAALAAIPLAVASPAYAVQAEAPSAVSALPATVSTEGAVHAQTVLTKVNELRASKGLAPVTRYVELDNVAQGWSEQMAATSTMEHNPNYSSSYPAGWSRAAENVAMRGGDSSSTDIGAMIFDQWLNSPGHYANMVDPDTNAIGIGMAYNSSEGAWYSTQNFAAYSDASSLTQTGGGSSNGSSGSNGSNGTDRSADSATPPQSGAPSTPAPPQGQTPPEQSTPPQSGPTAPSTSAPAVPPTTEPTPTPSAPSTEPTTPSTTAPASASGAPGTGSQGSASASANGATVSAVAVASGRGGTPGGSTLAQTGTSVAAAFVAQALVGAGLFILLRRRRQHS